LHVASGAALSTAAPLAVPLSSANRAVTSPPNPSSIGEKVARLHPGTILNSAPSSDLLGELAVTLQGGFFGAGTSAAANCEGCHQRVGADALGSRQQGGSSTGLHFFQGSSGGGIGSYALLGRVRRSSAAVSSLVVSGPRPIAEATEEESLTLPPPTYGSGDSMGSSSGGGALPLPVTSGRRRKGWEPAELLPTSANRSRGSTTAFGAATSAATAFALGDDDEDENLLDLLMRTAGSSGHSRRNGNPLAGASDFTIHSSSPLSRAPSLHSGLPAPRVPPSS
ncbi:hypothetical protein Vretifemale_15417, partial [Volvox reticuliferus]